MADAIVRFLAPVLGEDDISVFLACAPSWAVGLWMILVAVGVAAIVGLSIRFRHDGRLCTAIAVGGTAVLVTVAWLSVLLSLPVLVG